MERELSPFQRRVVIFFIGFIGYSIMEVFFRGYTHWTMAVTGGVAFTMLFAIQEHMGDRPLWWRCLAGTAVITLVEFIVGCIVNLWLGWDVWDYSMYRIQLLGQVCLVFSCLWFLLCGPIFFIANKMRQSWQR